MSNNSSDKYVIDMYFDLFTFMYSTVQEICFHLLKVRDALRGGEDDANALRPRGLSVNYFLCGAHGPAAGLELSRACVLFI
jgi:hypothetical protein